MPPRPENQTAVPRIGSKNAKCCHEAKPQFTPKIPLAKVTPKTRPFLNANNVCTTFHSSNNKTAWISKASITLGFYVHISTYSKRHTFALSSFVKRNCTLESAKNSTTVVCCCCGCCSGWCCCRGCCGCLVGVVVVVVVVVVGCCCCRRRCCFCRLFLLFCCNPGAKGAWLTFIPWCVNHLHTWSTFISIFAAQLPWKRWTTNASTKLSPLTPPVATSQSSPWRYYEHTPGQRDSRWRDSSRAT